MSEDFLNGVKRTSPFVPHSRSRAAGDTEKATFAARHFAARRAGFLLREYARQADAPIVEDLAGSESKIEGIGVSDVSTISIEPKSDPDHELGTVDESQQPMPDIESLIASAESRGRAAAISELSAIMEASIVSLSSAAEAFSIAKDQLQSRLIITLSKGCVELAEQIARASLSTSEGFVSYFSNVVSAAISSQRVASERLADNGSCKVRMNPGDVERLMQSESKFPELQIVPDESVSVGGVIINIDNKVLDDRFEGRVQEVRDALEASTSEMVRAFEK